MSLDKWTLTFDADNGSDTAASGCGPLTAVSGANADNTASIQVFELGVSTTGVTTDHVFWVDSSIGRRLYKISSVGATSVTVTQAPGIQESGRIWGIGGARRDPFNAANEGAGLAGDMWAGMTLELTAGTTAPYGALDKVLLTGSVSGDNAGGPITIRGVGGQATIQLGAFNANHGIVLGSLSRWRLFDLFFDLTGSSAFTYAVDSFIGGDNQIVRCRFDGTGSGNQTRGITMRGGGDGVLYVLDCTFIGMRHGIEGDDGGVGRDGAYVDNCYFEAQESHALVLRKAGCIAVQRNVINSPAGHGMFLGGSTFYVARAIVTQNTIYNTGAGSDGIRLTDNELLSGVIRNNLIDNVRYGIEADSASSGGYPILCGYNNITGQVQDYGPNMQSWNIEGSDTNTAPGWSLPSFAPGAALENSGHPKAPVGVGNDATTLSYSEVGAAQLEAGGGGGGDTYQGRLVGPGGGLIA